MQVNYPIKIQVIRGSAQKPRLYVTIPMALAAALGLEPGEEVEWEVLDRGELHLVRGHTPNPRAKSSRSW